MLGRPGQGHPRAFSDFGFSYVYSYPRTGTGHLLARSRPWNIWQDHAPTPQGVKPRWGPMRRAWLGLPVRPRDKTGKERPGQLRSFQGLVMRYWLPGVRSGRSASVGGSETVPGQRRSQALLAYKNPLDEGHRSRCGDRQQRRRGPLVEFSGKEYWSAGPRYAKSVKDIGTSCQNHERDRRPDPQYRPGRLGPTSGGGVADLDGEGDAVGGIVSCAPERTP